MVVELIARVSHLDAPVGLQIAPHWALNALAFVVELRAAQLSVLGLSALPFLLHEAGVATCALSVEQVECSARIVNQLAFSILVEVRSFGTPDAQFLDVFGTQVLALVSLALPVY